MGEGSRLQATRTQKLSFLCPRPSAARLVHPGQGGMTVACCSPDANVKV